MKGQGIHCSTWGSNYRLHGHHRLVTADHLLHHFQISGSSIVPSPPIFFMHYCTVNTVGKHCQKLLTVMYMYTNCCSRLVLSIWYTKEVSLQVTIPIFSPHKPAWWWLYWPYQWCQSRAVCTCMLLPRILGNHEQPWYTHMIIMLYYTIWSTFLLRGESPTWNLFFVPLPIPLSLQQAML